MQRTAQGARQAGLRRLGDDKGWVQREIQASHSVVYKLSIETKRMILHNLNRHPEQGHSSLIKLILQIAVTRQ